MSTTGDSDDVMPLSLVRLSEYPNPKAATGHTGSTVEVTNDRERRGFPGLRVDYARRIVWIGENEWVPIEMVRFAVRAVAAAKPVAAKVA